MITVPQGWTLSYINDFAFVNPESINSKYDENFQIEYVDISSIENLKISSYELYLLKDAPSRARRIIRNNYILFSTVRPYLKAIAYVDHVGDKNNVVCSTGYAVLKEKTSKSKAKYLYYCVQNDSFLKEVMRVAEGSNYPAISDMEFKRLKLLLPSLPEQQKIAEILSGIDRSIEAMQTLIDKEKMIKKGLMADLLNHGIDEEGRIRTPQTHRYIESPLGMIPEGWEVKCLGEVGECINGLTYSPEDVVDYDGILVLRSSNIQGNKLAFDDNVYVRSDMRIKDRVQANDILICVRNGSKALIGKNALISEEAQGQAHGAFMTIFRTKNYKYIFQLFQSDMYIAQVEKNLGATINSINNSDLLIFQFPMPINLAEEQKIAQILSAQDQKIETEEANLTKLQNLKKALMNDLLSGEVRVKG